MKKILSTLLILFPISFITGPLIPEIILAILSIYANFQIIKFKEYHYYKHIYSIFFLIFWFYLIGNSVVVSEYYFWSLKSSFFYFRYYIFSIAVIYFLHKKIVDLKKIGTYLSLSFIIIIFDLIFQYYYGQNLIGYKTIENRNSGFFGEELILGSYLIKIFPIILAILISGFIKIKKEFIIVILLPLLVVILFLTGERTATILGIIFVIGSSIFIINGLKSKIIYISILLIIPITLIIFSQNIQKRFFHDTLNYISFSTYNKYISADKKNSKVLEAQGEKKIYIFSKLHHGHYLSAYNLFLNKPFLGNGVNTFRYECKKFKHDYHCSTHPHNYILQILAETGLLGLIFYLIIYFYFINNFFKKNFIGIKILSLGLLIYLFPFSPSGNFFNNWLNMMLYYVIGLYMFFKLHLNKHKNE